MEISEKVPAEAGKGLGKGLEMTIRRLVSWFNAQVRVCGFYGVDGYYLEDLEARSSEARKLIRS